MASESASRRPQAAGSNPQAAAGEPQAAGRTLMICAAANELRDGDVVFVGIGLPSIACNLARRTHAPRLELIYESGAIGTRPERIPLSIGDPALVTGALMVVPMTDVFQYFLQRGHVDVGFLGAAQIDRFGNINTTVIGPYETPRVRLPGAGGAVEIALHAKRVLVVATLDRRAFPADVDFITSPGTRVSRVITDKCVFERDEERGELVLSAIHEGVSVDDVRAAVGWELHTAERVGTIAPPSAATIDALRELQSRHS